jgi:hypothetical protein
MGIFVMDNIDKFLQNKDVFSQEVVQIDGKKYNKIWYVDNRGLYQFVYDHAPENAVVDENYDQ